MSNDQLQFPTKPVNPARIMWSDASTIEWRLKNVCLVFLLENKIKLSAVYEHEKSPIRVRNYPTSPETILGPVTSSCID